MNLPVETTIKKELMGVREFLNFKQLAKQKKIPFNCEHKGNGNYLVEAEEYYMSLIGF